MKQSFGEKFKSLFSKNKGNEDFYEELIDILVEGDIGAKTAYEIVDELEENCKKNKITDEKGRIKESGFRYLENCRAW